MRIIKLTDKTRKKIIKKRPIVPAAKEGARIKILATGCEHCRAMRANTIDAVKQMGLPENELQCVSDIVDITRLGVMSTPSLIIDGELVSSGRVLSVEAIQALIHEYYDNPISNANGGEEDD